ncbi:MAG: phosphate ABC transporter substrate-binding protein PstS [Bifidobacteriaceae bacterium]|jgi:phosphate transport system substrate-binding protein|nr:phosphate ABC transporter substrate-binding protein PstS [Bifidobacteriaceae bacterium]MCI1978178.1 phosphate ABC transporter substrate-binding protein PstS [Bifidobacteriaceae bacterium]
MQINALRKVSAVGIILAMAAGLSACGDNQTTANAAAQENHGEEVQLKGEFAGSGASSQKSAVDAWIARFNANQPDATIAYDPSGSGAGVSTFLTGATLWAGTDAALTSEQVEQSKKVCEGQTAFDIPVYISPIAVVYNLKNAGLNDTHVNLSPATIAQIFNGKITKWNDKKIAAENPKIASKLPDLNITPVWRSDKSGTTKNFVSYLADASDGAWTYEVGENWPNKIGMGAKGTSGIVSTVSQAEGTIGYVDASQAGSLGTAAIKVGDNYVPYSAEAAAKVVDASPRDKDATEKGRVVIDIDHTTTESGAYPLVLVSYDAVCPVYKDTQDGEFVKQWLSYVVSEEGQSTAAENAGSAPMSPALRSDVLKSIDLIGSQK